MSLFKLIFFIDLFSKPTQVPAFSINSVEEWNQLYVIRLDHHSSCQRNLTIGAWWSSTVEREKKKIGHWIHWCWPGQPSRATITLGTHTLLFSCNHLQQIPSSTLVGSVGLTLIFPFFPPRVRQSVQPIESSVCYILYGCLPLLGLCLNTNRKGECVCVWDTGQGNEWSGNHPGIIIYE